MENVLVENNSLNEYFEIEYETQNLDKNPSYLNWKESMLILKGRNTKFLKCEKDNIIFSCTKKSLREYPVYQSTCPKCNKNICYYCSIHTKDSYGNGTCCVKRRITCMFLQDGFRFIKPIGEEHDYPLNYSVAFKFFIIPVFSFLMFISEMQVSFFYKLKLKKSEVNEHGYAENYEDFIKDRYYDFITIMVVINVAFAVMLAIPFLLLNIYFTVFLLVISLPFKNYPLKYFIGIAYGKES